MWLADCASMYRAAIGLWAGWGRQWGIMESSSPVKDEQGGKMGRSCRQSLRHGRRKARRMSVMPLGPRGPGQASRRCPAWPHGPAWPGRKKASPQGLASYAVFLPGWRKVSGGPPLACQAMTILACRAWTLGMLWPTRLPRGRTFMEWPSARRNLQSRSQALEGRAASPEVKMSTAA